VFLYDAVGRCSTDCSPCRVHGIAQTALFEETLDLRNFLGDGGGRRAEGDKAKICYACWWSWKIGEVL
jgi:hypothetical protein